MMIPRVHLNGTSKEQLLGGYIAARQALIDAYVRLHNVEVNARDYYPLSTFAFSQAVREHDARKHKLKDVLDELEELVEKIDAQGGRL